jgi:hypothetical protein
MISENNRLLVFPTGVMNVLTAAAPRKEHKMKTFTIENETNNITLHVSPEAGQAIPDSERFTTADEFVDLAGAWPTSRLIEIWNGIPGVTPVKKFKDRATAATRIWAAIQSLDGDVSSEPAVEAQASAPETEPEVIAQEVAAEITAAPEANAGAQEPDIAPAEEPATDTASSKEEAPTSERAARTREGSKTEQAIGLMKAPGATTLKTLMETFGWQAHSVRGFISGTLTKKMRLTVVSTKGEDGQRTYTIAS